MADLQLTKVAKSFGPVDVLHGIDLDIRSGEFIVFVGPSGCGKSTLLRVIAGLEDLTSGTLEIDGDVVNALSPSRRGIAMVFQSYALYPHMTVRQNMAFGLKLAKTGKAQIDRKVDEVAKLLQLDDLLDRLPKQLSGGQRQRVAIGRAITRNPRVFLFDEPLSNLDAELRVQMRLEIAKLHKKLNTTMIYVTHDQVEAMTLAERIVVLRDGNIEQVGSPIELYEDPDNQFVAGFIGSPKMNFVDAEVAPDGVSVTIAAFDGLSLKIPTRAPLPAAGTLVVAGLRPEHFIEPAPRGGKTFQGAVSVVEVLGSSSLLYVETAGHGVVTVQKPGKTGVREGEVMKIGIDPDRCFLFGADGTRL
ncbi:Maltose/maltodextrin transport ATP-binding protein MalK [hydrothermal vent metagenome]|uniref:Maltose/maltodextrin transport ATP-binding protein MalK n=1 Tax=hydrothermal vent metagenome TaxID=652676 RepID=A0A3B0TUU8_9ZZZZ